MAHTSPISTFEHVAARVHVMLTKPGVRIYVANLVDDYLAENQARAKLTHDRRLAIEARIRKELDHPRAGVRQRQHTVEQQSRLLHIGFEWRHASDTGAGAWIPRCPEVLSLGAMRGGTWLSEDCALLAAAHDLHYARGQEHDEPSRIRMLRTPADSDELAMYSCFDGLVDRLKEAELNRRECALMVARMEAGLVRLGEAVQIMESALTGTNLDPNQVAAMASTDPSSKPYQRARTSVMAYDAIVAAKTLLAAMQVRCREIEFEVEGQAKVPRWERFTRFASDTSYVTRPFRALLDSADGRLGERAIVALQALFDIDRSDSRHHHGNLVPTALPETWSESKRAIADAYRFLVGLRMSPEHQAAKHLSSAANHLERFVHQVAVWFPDIEGEWRYAKQSTAFDFEPTAHDVAKTVYGAFEEIDWALKAVGLRNSAGEGLKWGEIGAWARWKNWIRPPVAPELIEDTVSIGKTIDQWMERRHIPPSPQNEQGIARERLPADSATWAANAAAAIKAIAQRLEQRGGEPEHPHPPTDPAIEVKIKAVCRRDMALNILSALLGLQARSARTRKAYDAVSERAGYGSAANGSFKAECGWLRDTGLIEAKKGRSGGAWITPEGVAVHDRAKQS
ncbi:MAG: hypothetical protein AB7K52_15655 [Phycisphaerales bacterium]